MSEFPDMNLLLPHQAPMILVHKLIHVTPSSVHCQVKIDTHNLFFDSQLNAVPSWVGIEFLAQTIAAWSGYHAYLENRSPTVGFLLGTRRYRANCDLFAKDTILDLYAEQLMENEGMAAFTCRIKCRGEELITTQLNVFVPPPEQLEMILKGKKNA
jgi:predicted hotdog family 3-hydroxylacyl-ACP dehydratase